MHSLIRRLAPLALAATLLAGLAPMASATEDVDTSSSAIVAAERAMLTLTNSKRAAEGLVALRLDPRMADLARRRAEYLAATDEFSHTQADGTSVFDMINASGITWYGAGEILAWNTASLLDYSAAFAVQGWMGSPSHRAIVMTSDYNYVGFGLAISPTTGKRYWAGVYVKAPDQTAGWSKVTSVRKVRVDARRVRVTLAWDGGDRRLQVLTSGLRYYQAQKRRDGGRWYSYDVTTRTSMTRTWSRGHTYEFRVRSRDKAGNWGAWTKVVIKT